MCIFQDSVSDWQQESGAMSSVYGGAICNIAANAAEDGHAGMFRQRNPDLVRPCQISTLWDNHENVDLYLTETNWWEKCLDNDPLGQRSWVLQEDLLARRVINFSTRQIFWECSQIHANETFPKGIKTANYKKKLSSLLAGRSPESVCREAKLRSPEELLRWLWLDAVNSYSQRRLTKPSDKFVALSGVARILEGIFNESYLCGLWRRNLAQQLCWFTASSNTTTFPLQYRAPSWTWASVDDEVFLPHPLDEYELHHMDRAVLDILHIDVEYTTSDHTREVTSGILKVSGPLFVGQISHNRIQEFSRPSYYFSLSNFQGQVELDSGSPASITNPRCLIVEAPLGNYGKFSCLILEPTGMKRGQFR